MAKTVLGPHTPSSTKGASGIGSLALMSRCTVSTSARRFWPPLPTEPLIWTMIDPPLLPRAERPPVRSPTRDLVVPLAVIWECNQFLDCFLVSVKGLLRQFSTAGIRAFRVVLCNVVCTSATCSHLHEFLLGAYVGFPNFRSWLWLVSFAQNFSDRFSFLGCYHSAIHQLINAFDVAIAEITNERFMISIPGVAW